MNVKKMSNTSHETDVVSGHIASPHEAMKWMLQYFRGTSVTYSGCNDFVDQILLVIWTK